MNFNIRNTEDTTIFSNDYYNLNIHKIPNCFFIVNNGKRFIKTNNNNVIMPRILLQEGNKPDTNTPFKIIDSFENIFIWTDHYGDKNICHWFHEQLNGIIFLSQLYKFFPDIKIIVNKNAPLKKNIKDVLFLIPNFKEESIYELDISNNCIAIQSKNMYLNFGSFNYNLNIPVKIFKFFVDELNINPQIDDNDNQKEEYIYISRRKTNTNSRKLNNIDEISDYIIKNKYKEVFMEDMSIKEKILTIYNSKNIIMEIGAGCINLCFCNPSVNIILLTQKTNEMTLFYNTMFKPVLQGKNINFIYGKRIENENIKGVNTPWHLDINNLKNYI